MSKSQKGLIIVNTGDGKGKTTAALGTAVRAAGHNMKVIIFQFMKGAWKYGELEALKLIPQVEILQMGGDFTWKKESLDEDRRMARDAWEKSKQVILSGDYQMVVLDELNYVLGYELLPLEEVLDFLRQKPRDLHLIITGRRAKPEIIEIADLVTEMKEIKHPFSEQGIEAVKGVDF